MGNVVVLKNYQLVKGSGRHHRIICMTGERRGEVYYIKSKRVLLGRSKQADIAIYDSQSSREHAELSRVGSDYILTDLNSNNGVIVNGRKAKQVQLKTKDRIIIGKTVYKYEVIDIDDDDRTGQLRINQEEKAEQPALKSQKGKKRKGPILLVLLGAILFLTLEEDRPQNKKVLPKRINGVNSKWAQIQVQRQSKQDEKMRNRLNTIMQRGIRELREKNYYRAINEFNLALIIDPKGPRALTYKRKAKDLLDKDIEAYFDQAARDFASFNHDKMIKNYCQIIKILEDFPEDERYKSAQENLEQLVKKFGVKKSAIDCY